MFQCVERVLVCGVFELDFSVFAWFLCGVSVWLSDGSKGFADVGSCGWRRAGVGVGARKSRNLVERLRLNSSYL